MIHAPSFSGFHQVHLHGLILLKSEDDAPVAGQGDAPEARHVALQRMQPETRLNRQIAWVMRLIQQGQNSASASAPSRSALAVRGPGPRGREAPRA